MWLGILIGGTVFGFLGFLAGAFGRHLGNINLHERNRRLACALEELLDAVEIGGTRLVRAAVDARQALQGNGE